MKELSIEQKAKAYDDLLVKLQEAKVDNNVCDDRYCCVIDDIVPELKGSAESEDKEIRKVLIDYFNQYKEQEECGVKTFYGIPTDNILAWLEKRGEQKLDGTFVNVDDVREDFVNEVYRVLDADSTNDRANQIIDAFDNLPTVSIEKQGEQKPADNVEPKYAEIVRTNFKDGDWVVYQNETFQVRILPNGSRLLQGEKYQTYFIDELCRPWTIRDAKDGDILAAEDKIFLYNGKLDLRGRACAYCGIYQTYNELRFTKCAVGNYFTYKEPHPATKEQRDLLFQKMKEAGYEWDAEKKELKRIEQNPIIPKFKVGDVIRLKGGASEYTVKRVTDTIYYTNGWSCGIKRCEEDYELVEQKSAEWSEEDESMRKTTILYLENTKDSCAAACVPYIVKCINWLKSLRPQSTWKPSDGQIKVCKKVYADLLSAKGFDLGTVNSELNRLEEELKKLREE